MGDALIDKPGFFFAGDDLHRAAQNGTGRAEKIRRVGGQTQGSGGDHANLSGRNILQMLGKQAQALPAPLHGVAG